MSLPVNELIHTAASNFHPADKVKDTPYKKNSLLNSFQQKGDCR